VDSIQTQVQSLVARFCGEACAPIYCPQTSPDVCSSLIDAAKGTPRQTGLCLLTGGQIRAARALLKWIAQDLARKSALGVNTVRRAETSEGETSLTTANELAVRRAFEDAGVEFGDQNGGGAGVRLRKSAHSRPA
jgi:hypothetical protein